jgi:multicomponent Na+:H+ antiporter subunit E
MTRIYYFIRYLFIFAKALAIANIDVAKKALAPRISIRPGFLAVPMLASSDFEITALANSITLTPGTISVHVARDHRTIVIHAIDVGDNPDAVRRDVQQTLEANILKWTRAEREQK